MQGLPEERAQAVIKGDDTCYCIAAASVIAKVSACIAPLPAWQARRAGGCSASAQPAGGDSQVTRDRIMLEYDLLWPQYDLKNNKVRRCHESPRAIGFCSGGGA